MSECQQNVWSLHPEKNWMRTLTTVAWGYIQIHLLPALILMTGVGYVSNFQMGGLTNFLH